MTDDYFERLVDEAALESFLASELGESDRFEVEHHPAGHSNETLFVRWGDEEYVLRRPPPGEVAETAHDVLREYRVMSALQNTDVPVARTVLGCDDHSVLGSDFYLVGRVEGDVIRDTEPDRFADPDRRERLGRELIDALVRVHGVDYEAVGLGDFGRPEGFTDRQVERWTKQLEWAFERTESVREVPELREIGEWLDENTPASHPHTLVHGDYKLDNVMFGPAATPEVVGLFDWELSALGDPLTDLGWLLVFWRDPTDPDPALPELVSSIPEREGYPSRRELVDRYEARSGRDFEHERFYRTLGVYKLAGLGEMFYRRHLEGNSDDPLYPKMESRVPALAERALRIVDGEEPL